MNQSLWTKKHSYIAWSILALALAVRLFRLTSACIWIDEVRYWEEASKPNYIQCVFFFLSDTVAPPLYATLLFIIAHIHDSLWTLRGLSAVSGAAAVGAVLLIGRRWMAPFAALSAGLLAALAPMHIYYSQEMKTYALLSFFLLMALYETLRCLEDSGRKWWPLALWIAASLYGFFLSAFYIAALFTGVAWAGLREKGAWKNPSKGLVMGVMLYLPWWPVVLKNAWIQTGSAANDLIWWAPFFSLGNFSVGFWAKDALAVAGAICFTALAVWGWLKRERFNPQAMIALFILIPMALFLLASLGLKPVYSDRAMVVSALALALLAGTGVDRLKYPWRHWGLAILVGLQVASLSVYWFQPQSFRMDYRQAFETVRLEWKAGDAIFHNTIETYYPFKYMSRQEPLDPAIKPALPVSPQKSGIKPNWMYEAPPEFLIQEKGRRLQSLWRGLNLWLTRRGLGAYVGYDRGKVYGWRLDHEALSGVKRIWYVVSTPGASRKNLMPMPNVFRGAEESQKSRDWKSPSWLERGFLSRGTRETADATVYLFEKKK